MDCGLDDKASLGKVVKLYILTDSVQQLDFFDRPSSIGASPSIRRLPSARSARLLSNVVDCAVGAVQIGMPVQVKFEQHEDVWLPLFAPTDVIQANPGAAA